MSGHNRPSIGTTGGNDLGARMARLQDLIERDARGSAQGLPVIFHEVAGVGAMHAPGENDIVLVTLVTTGGQSHVFAMDNDKAAHFRGEIVSLRRSVTVMANQADSALRRAPVTKPGGRLL